MTGYFQGKLMKKLFFRGNVSIEDYRRFVSTNSHGLAENVFIARYELGYKQIFREWLRNTFAVNDKRVAKGKEPVELEITIKAHYDDRTVSENALLWILYTNLCEILNHENPRLRVTPQQLYDKDMEDYAPIHEIDVPENLVSAFILVAEMGEDNIKGHLIKKIDNGDGTWHLVFQESSSFWDIVRFSDLIKAKIDELEDMGRTRMNDGFVRAIIDDFHAHMKEKK
jgi:hypothetical protein